MATEFYDAYWKSGFHTGSEWSDDRFEKVLGCLRGRKSILDYGCGMGYNYQSLLKKAADEYTAADVSDVALADAGSKGCPVVKIAEDGKLDVKDNSFDGATCIEVMEHLFDPLAAAKELHRVLAPGGILVATVPNFGYHAWRLMALLRARVPSEPENPSVNRHNGVHIRYFNTATFERLFLDAGFSRVKISSFDDSTIWDISRAFGPFAAISDFARSRFPKFAHLEWLQDICPSVFAYRIRAEAIK